MAASDRTVEMLYAILTEFVDHETLTKIIDRFTEVPGNRSFRDTVEKLRSEHADRGRLLRTSPPR